MRQIEDVLIVGGGPTGLLLACELAIAGIRPIVIERRTEPVAQPRARALQPRTVEVLALRGIVHRFLEYGVKLPEGHYAGLPTGLNYEALDSKHSYVLAIPQTRVEALLEQWALELGVDVRRGWQIAGVKDKQSHVEVSGTGPMGAFELSSRYVVGADGARSTVREQAGIGFSGKDVTRTFYFGDVVLTNPPSAAFRSWTDKGAVVAGSIEKNLYRINFIDPERFSVPLSEPVTLQEIQRGLNRIVGTATVASDPCWLSRFGDESKLADQYRRGRIFLVGDAAHIHIPAGGQGMNTGMQDSLNLGWKLASVIRGLAPESLLESYEAERRPIGEFLIDNTLAQTAVMCSFDAEGTALRNMINELLRMPEVNRKLSGEISALHLAYAGPLLKGHEVGAKGWAGRRLPDIDLRLSSGAKTTLYTLLHKGNWLDLRFGAAPPSPLPPGISAELLKVEVAELLEESSELNALSAVLVRPDGHIAYARAR